jgi:hypothetical protein
MTTSVMSLPWGSAAREGRHGVQDGRMERGDIDFFSARYGKRVEHFCLDHRWKRHCIA